MKKRVEENKKIGSATFLPCKFTLLCKDRNVYSLSETCRVVIQ